MEIKPIPVTDIDTLSALSTRVFIETFAHGYKPEELEKQIEATRSVAYFSQALQDDRILGAYHDNRLLGYVQFGRIKLDVIGDFAKPDDRAVNAIYIDSEFQGQGVGEALLKAALNHPELVSQEKIFVDVWSENKNAYSFYKKHGFQEIGQCEVKVDGEVVGYDLVLVLEQ